MLLIGAFEIEEPLPQLKEPHVLAMLRPWVDVGSVGGLTLTRLERHLGAKELGRLTRPGTFFDFTRYRPTIVDRGGKREIVVPNSFVSYAKRPQGHDFLFLHMLEPHSRGEDYVDSVLEVLKTLGAKRYALVGAMYDAVPHTRPLLVTGTVAGQALSQKAGQARVQPSSYQGPTTIMYLLSQRAPELGMETANVIVHLPQYVQLDEDFSGTARALEVLREIYDLPEHLIDRKRGEAQYQEISRALTGNPQMRPLIQQLEAQYDAQAAQQAQQEASSPLSPEVEKFLREMDQRFEKN